MMWVLLPIAIILLFAWLFKESNERLEVKGRSVFISGCDTGFGHTLALRLDKLGLKVFACCLTEIGAQNLKKESSDQLISFKCDITNKEDINNAVSLVEKHSKDGLWALVNNAGILSGGEWDWIPEKHFKQTMDVNFFGHVYVTQSFLPLLKKSKGRIVNLTSIGGVITIVGPYSCSKYAMEAFSDSLRREMKQWGISVFIVEPGYTDTPMLSSYKSAVQNLWKDVSIHTKKEYGDEYLDALLAQPAPSLDPPNIVVDALQAKVINKYPSLRTQVGPFAKLSLFISYLPTSWSDIFINYIVGRSKIPLPASLQKQ